MPNRRLAVVAALAVVEVWIVGLMFRSIHSGPHAASAASGPAFPASAQAAGGPLGQTLETGPAPHVVVDDESAAVNVSVRPGTTVSVTQQIRTRGWTHISDRRATIEKTADGVEIDAPAGMTMFGSFERRLDVIVPPGARLDVQNAGSIEVAGLRREATVNSDDGRIVVRDHVGALTVKSDGGRIELIDVRGPSIDVTSDDGRIVCDRVRADAVALSTDNGSIDVSRSLLGSGKIKTDNGRIRLGLDPQSNVTVAARVAAGSVTAEAPLVALPGADDAPSLVRIGNGAGRLDVGSDNGSISIQMGGV